MPESIDVTGLPEAVIQDIQRLVTTLRERLGQGGTLAPSAADLAPEAWIARFRAWAASHPKRDIVLDDSRDTIYGGRGE